MLMLREKVELGNDLPFLNPSPELAHSALGTLAGGALKTPGQYTAIYRYAVPPHLGHFLSTNCTLCTSHKWMEPVRRVHGTPFLA